LFWAGEVAQVMEGLPSKPSKCEALSFPVPLPKGPPYNPE
jgi:hypothetical protein